METTAANLIPSGPIRCSRLLSRNGTVLVYPGQTTDPTTQIAHRGAYRKHFSVSIMGDLGITKRELIREHLVINEGDFVSINEPIARAGDHVHRTVTAKQSGRFLGISSGNLIFESDQRDFESVLAGFPGVVAEVIPNRGAFIETQGAFIHGVWANGKSGQGILLALETSDRKSVLSASNLSMAMSGSIVFANSCYDADVLQATGRLGPGGLIFGSLPSELIPIALRLPFPVLVTDTVGYSRFSSPVKAILDDNIIKCAYIYSLPARGNVPGIAEVIIPQDFEMGIVDSPTEIKVGSQVRVLEGVYIGEVGTVTELLPWDATEDIYIQPHEDQIRVRLDSVTEIEIAVTNVELIHL